MNTHSLEKSSAITPLLVKLYDTHKLYDLTKKDMPLIRAELGHEIVNLLQTDIVEDQEKNMLSDVLIGLMRRAEQDLRCALSERLATCEHVPLQLMLHLTNDDIAIASPVLEKSPVLNDLDLIYIIESKKSPYWQSIAKRSALNDLVINRLAETEDLETCIFLSKNERIRLTEYALDILGNVAKDHDKLAKPLLMRPEVPENLARYLYDHVGKEIQDYISAFFGIKNHDARKAADDIILAFSELEMSSKFMPTQKMMDSAEEKAALKILRIDDMMGMLTQGNIPAFIAHFAVYTRTSPKKIHDFLKQSRPRGMAIVCRAFGIQKNDFVKIYLMTHKMRSEHRRVNHDNMLEVIQYFDHIRPESAARVVVRQAS